MDEVQEEVDELKLDQAEFSRVRHTFNNITITGNAVLGDLYGANGDMLLDGKAAHQREAIIRALTYQGMNDKRRIIEPADPRSLKWIETSDYIQWLKNDDRVLWFDGKPGSGKSTLMKYLTTTALTRNTLPKDGLKWYITWFFFDFRSGVAVANAPEGMLRAILLQWIKHDHSVAKALGDDVVNSLLDDTTVSTLLDYFSQMSQIAQSRLCIFLDGLDECQSSLVDLMSVILQFKDCTHSKICLASRPYPAIKETLQRFPRICVQDHNSQSIQSYLENVANRLENDLTCVCPPSLIKSVVKKADGIILWARFAFEPIVEGWRQGQEISTLLRKCDHLPSAVNDMYENALKRIPERFGFEAACYLLLIDNSKYPMTTAELHGLSRSLDIEFPGRIRLPQNLTLDQFERRLLVLLGSLINVSALDAGTYVRRLTRQRGLAATSREARRASRTKLQLNAVTTVHETFHAYLAGSAWYWHHLRSVVHKTHSDSSVDWILSLYTTSMLKLSPDSVTQSLEETFRASPNKLVTDEKFRDQWLEAHAGNDWSCILVPLRLLVLAMDAIIHPPFQTKLREALRSVAMLPMILWLVVDTGEERQSCGKAMQAMLASNDMDIFWAFLGPLENYLRLELFSSSRVFSRPVLEGLRDLLWQYSKGSQSEPGGLLDGLIQDFFEHKSKLNEWHFWDLAFTEESRDLRYRAFLAGLLNPRSYQHCEKSLKDAKFYNQMNCAWYRLAMEKFEQGEEYSMSKSWMRRISQFFLGIGWGNPFARGRDPFNNFSTHVGDCGQHGLLLSRYITVAIVGDRRRKESLLPHANELRLPVPDAELGYPRRKELVQWEKGAILDVMENGFVQAGPLNLEFYKKLAVVLVWEASTPRIRQENVNYLRIWHQARRWSTGRAYLYDEIQEEDIKNSPVIAECYEEVGRYSFDFDRSPRWCLNS